MRRIIHQIWFQGERNILDTHKPSIAALKRLNPSWRHVMWDEASLRQTCAAICQGAADLFDAYPHMHQKIDFGRYCVLHQHGGISVDVDVTPLLPFDTLFTEIDDNGKILVSKVNAREWEMILSNMVFQGTLRNVMINNAIIIAPRPGNPALLHLVKSLVRSGPRARNPNASKMQEIMETTGPVNFTRLILERREEIKILDSKYFEPCVGYDVTCGPSRESILYHQHDGTWLKAHTRYSAAYYYHLKSHATMHALLIALTLLALALFWKFSTRRP
jgi:mannosyltransferase OCH1-like enzyme